MSNLTTFELPTPPSLSTPRYPEGARVPLRVFGWCFTVDDLIKWADENEFAVGEARHHKYSLAMEEIQSRLPVGHRRLVRVYDEKHLDIGDGVRPCFVIGSNKKQEHLDMAQDMKVINQFRAVLGADARLKWHKFLRVY